VPVGVGGHWPAPPPNPGTQGGGPSGPGAKLDPPPATSSPSQLPLEPRGRTVANIAVSGPSDRAAGLNKHTQNTPAGAGRCGRFC
jgi:hypothetical protein